MTDVSQADVLGIILGVVGVCLAVLFYLRQKQPKTIDYVILYATPILKAERSRQLAPRLTVAWDGQPLGQPYLIAVRIKNTGKRAVVESDYEGGIFVQLDEALVLECFTARTSIPNPFEVRPLRLNQDGDDRVVVRPGLLNPGEWFEVQFLADGEPRSISVSCRFIDQARPPRVMRYGYVRSAWIENILMTVIMPAVAMGPVFAGVGVGSQFSGLFAVALGLATGGVALGVLVIAVNRLFTRSIGYH